MTVTELVAVVLTEPLPDLRVVRPDVPPELAAAVGRCLEKKRDDRFASVADLVRAIAAVRPHRHRRHGGQSRRTRRRRLGQIAFFVDDGLRASPLARRPASPSTWDPATPRATVPMGNPNPPAGPSGFPEQGGDARPPSSSARLNIHGGTSVAWGETQVDRPPPKRARPQWPLVAGALGLVLLLASAGTGAVFYVKRANASGRRRPAGSMTLPPGRKDLPPVASGSTTDRADADARDRPADRGRGALGASLLPRADEAARGASPSRRAGRPGEGPSGRRGPRTAPPTAPPAPAKPAPTDDLSNIGRR